MKYVLLEVGLQNVCAPFKINFEGLSVVMALPGLSTQARISSTNQFYVKKLNNITQVL